MHLPKLFLPVLGTAVLAAALTGCGTLGRAFPNPGPQDPAPDCSLIPAATAVRIMGPLAGRPQRGQSGCGYTLAGHPDAEVWVQAQTGLTFGDLRGEISGGEGRISAVSGVTSDAFQVNYPSRGHGLPAGYAIAALKDADGQGVIVISSDVSVVGKRQVRALVAAALTRL
jgi:hypothetical protein